MGGKYDMDDSPQLEAVTSGAANADGAESPAAADAREAAGATDTHENEQPQAARYARAGWFRTSHDDVAALLSASTGITGMRNLAVWTMLCRAANLKRSTSFAISSDIIGADLRGVDRRTVRAALEDLRDCGLIEMSEPERNTATNRFNPTIITLHATCSPAPSRVQKTYTEKQKPYTSSVQGDADAVTRTILKRLPKGSYKSLPFRKIKRDTEDIPPACCADGSGGANVKAPPTTSANGRKKREVTGRHASHQPTNETPTLKVRTL